MIAVMSIPVRLSFASALHIWLIDLLLESGVALVHIRAGCNALMSERTGKPKRAHAYTVICWP